jgi:hypothetical protein
LPGIRAAYTPCLLLSQPIHWVLASSVRGTKGEEVAGGGGHPSRPELERNLMQDGWGCLFAKEGNRSDEVTSNA